MANVTYPDLVAGELTFLPTGDGAARRALTTKANDYLDVRDYGDGVGEGTEETDTTAFLATIAEAQVRGGVTGFYPTIYAPSGREWKISSPLVFGGVPFDIGGRLSYSGSGTAITYAGSRQRCWISELRRTSLPSGDDWDDIDICGLHVHTAIENLIQFGAIKQFPVGMKLGGRGENMSFVAYNTFIMNSIYSWQTAILIEHWGVTSTPNGVDTVSGLTTWVNDNKLIGPNCQLTSAGPKDRATYGIRTMGDYSGNANRIYSFGVQGDDNGQTTCIKSDKQALTVLELRNENVQAMYEFTDLANGVVIEYVSADKINGTVATTVTSSFEPHRVYRKGSQQPTRLVSLRAAVCSDGSSNSRTLYPFVFMSTAGVLSATTTAVVQPTPDGIVTPGARKVAVLIPVVNGDGLSISCANDAGRFRVAAYDEDLTLITDEWLAVPGTTFASSVYTNGTNVSDVSRAVYVQNDGVAFIAVSADNARTMRIARVMGSHPIEFEPFIGVADSLTSPSAPARDGDYYSATQRIMNSAPASGQPQGWASTANGYLAATEWASATAYTLGQYRHNDTDKVYVCTTAGTSAGSGGPTGAGTAISDGTAVWDYVGPRTTFVAMANFA